MISKSEKTSVLIVGGGALGSVFGWRLQLGGCSVSVVCRSNYEIVKNSGFQIESGKFGNAVFSPDHVFSSFNAAIAECDFYYDYIMVCTKTLPNISNPADVLMGSPINQKTAIVLIQNGVDIEQYFHEAFPNNILISAIAYIDTKQTESGVIVHGEAISLQFGFFIPEQTETQRSTSSVSTDISLLETLEKHLIAGNSGCKILDNVSRDRWLKLVWNSSLNPISVLSGGSNTKEMLANPVLCDLIVAAMMETITIGEAVCKMPLSPTIASSDIPEYLLGSVRKRIKPVYPSMLQDYLNKRPMEHEVILHNAIKRADSVGVNAPVLKTLYALIIGAEKKYLN
ncbi:Meiotically up-regulated gene 72 protein [Smittium culicis]|uniref:2-dehydropantoate 2-reductase n=1 Tax=Smittium culicis TaxID=133412 RepID=A0A1R1Y9V5_9FUNG|nr:Meiotically up-regulated gene 72 protein [Smittium culicis]